MKVLLINPSSHTKYPSPPLGLLQLGACLKQDGHEVRVLDMNLEHSYELYKQVGSFDIIGITAVTPNINEAINVSQKIKHSFPVKTIILGGPHATLLPEETFKAGCFDYIAKGEFDWGINSFLRTWPINTPKILFCNHEVDLNKLPMPDYSLIDISQYHPHPPHGRKKPWLPMITSRGCPFSCTFCSKPVFGKKYRDMDAKGVYMGLRLLKDLYGVKEVTFYDDVFTLNNERVFDICEGMRRWELNIDWSCETRTHLVNLRLLYTMKKAGCFLIAYGIESGSQPILETLNKGIKLEQVEQAIAYTREAGIQTIGYFMIGNPGETKEDINKTIQFAIDLKLDYAQFAITTPFPGSQLYEQYIAEGHQLPDWSAFNYANMGKATIPMFNSQNLTTGDIKQSLAEANKRFYLRLGYMWQRGLVAIKSWDDFKLLVNGAKVYLENMLK